MLKLTDLRKTTRRTGSTDVRTVYPHFLRDRSLAPRIEMAVRYLERNLGRPRRELDAEMVVQLFGDHKLARCIVACLGTTYRHRARTFAEVLPAASVEMLAAQGIRNASELRLWLFRRVNVAYAGFVGGAERAALLAGASEALGLAVAEVERLLTLDAPDQAVLVRTGPIPSADDVIARFNYETAAALLANAPVVRVALTRTPPNADAVRALCAIADVSATLSGRELVLQGRQDTLGNWTRSGARLVRVLSALLACGLPARSAEALVAAPAGEWRFRLDGEILRYLGATDASSAPPVALPALLECWQRVDAFAADFTALRRAGEAGGWTLRRAAEPLVLAGAVAPALFTCSRGTQRVVVVPAPSGQVEAERLAALAARVPLLAVRVVPEVGVALRTEDFAGAELVVLRYTGKGDLAALPELLARAAGEVEQRVGAAQIGALLEEARTQGMVAEAKIAERLNCGEDDVPERLRGVTLGDDLQYVEGFGLCTRTMLARAQAATQGLESLLTRQDGAARKMRVIGQRLREMTGAREGIECLIAYLGAA